MIRNLKGNAAGIAAVFVLSAFLLFKHGGATFHGPLKLPFFSPADTNQETVADGDYQLCGKWLLHAGTTTITVSKDGKQLYEESIDNCNSCRPLILLDKSSSYVADVTGDGQPDFVLEQVCNDSKSQTGELYTYTLYSLGDKGVRRQTAQRFDSPVAFRYQDGICEEICQDRTFVDFANDRHLGQSEKIICSWSGNGFSPSRSLMKREPLAPDALDKLAVDITAKIVRYDTTGSDGQQQKRIEIHPNAWSPIITLIYHGNATQARSLLDKVWMDDETALLGTEFGAPTTKKDFWHYLWQQLDKSPFAQEIKDMSAPLAINRQPEIAQT